MNLKEVAETKKRIKSIVTNECNQYSWLRYESDIMRYYYPTLTAWLQTGMKQHSTTAFTSGLGRDIARLMEDAKAQGKKETLVWVQAFRKGLSENDYGYPKNIFIEPTTKELYLLQSALENTGLTLDRFSAHIARQLKKVWQEDLEKVAREMME